MRLVRLRVNDLVKLQTLLQKVKENVPRIAHEIGRPLRLGDRTYKLRGYIPNRFARDFSDEPHLIPVFERILRSRNGAFIDVGSNVGQTLIKVLAIDPDRTYIGFEPQLEACFYVDKFLRSNSLSNAQIIGVALSDADGMVPLFSDRPNDTTASILSSHAYAAGHMRPHMNWVPARLGDTLFREMGVGEIAAIKIDVEGFELEVLAGLSETIRRKRPIVIFEVLSNYFWNELIDEPSRHQRSRRADKIFTFFADAGYAVSQIDSQGTEHRIERFDLDSKPHPRFGNEGRDYIARPLDERP